MKRFTIDDTEFGIDADASSFHVDTSDPTNPTITIEVEGDRAKFEPLTAEDNSKWSWALHPPAFYLRDFPVRAAPSSDVATARAERDDAEDYEFSIYMMEHNMIEVMDVQVIPSEYVAVTGRVDLMGDVHDFKIEWRPEEAA